MFSVPRPRLVAGVAVAATLAGVGVVVIAPGVAGADTTLPQIVALSTHSGSTDCGTDVTITGQNFSSVRQVAFGSVNANFQVLSPGKIVASVGGHGHATVTVRVVTMAGTSPKSTSARFVWAAQPLNIHTTKLNCGMTAAQAIANSNKFRRNAAKHKAVPTVKRSSHWTAAMGQNAVRRAQAWTGLSYSFAGGSASGPTYGVNSDGGGWFDSRIWGFDCSGLALYSWAPYKSMAHYAATQYKQAGSFHPGPNELMPGDLIFYSDTGHSGGIDHVQVYVGGGQIIQAPQSGYTIGTSTLYPGARPFYAATRPLSRGKQGAAPTLTRLSVTAGPTTGTTTVTAYGTGLNTVSTVLIDGTRSYDFTPLSSTRLRITLPAHAAGSVPIRIGGAWGVSNTLRFSYVGAPAVTAVSPNYGPAQTSQDVTITGTGFTGATGVTVGGVAATYGVTSDGTITATLPAMPAGTYPVVVTTQYGSSAGWTSYTYLDDSGGGDTGDTGGWSSGPGRGGPGSYGGGR